VVALVTTVTIVFGVTMAALLTEFTNLSAVPLLPQFQRLPNLAYIKGPELLCSAHISHLLVTGGLGLIFLHLQQFTFYTK
jgi:hypothetical protein